MRREEEENNTKIPDGAELGRADSYKLQEDQDYTWYSQERQEKTTNDVFNCIDHPRKPGL